LKLATLARQTMPEDAQVADTLGWVHFKLGEYRPAADLLQEAVKRQPNSALLHYHLGLTYAKLGQKLDAQRELQEALRLNPGSPYAADARKVLGELGE